MTPDEQKGERVKTAEGAKVEMLLWANGGKSYWNMICDALPVEDRATAFAETARADAAETQKWAAVYTALALPTQPRNPGS